MVSDNPAGARGPTAWHSRPTLAEGRTRPRRPVGGPTPRRDGRTSQPVDAPARRAVRLDHRRARRPLPAHARSRRPRCSCRPRRSYGDRGRRGRRGRAGSRARRDDHVHDRVALIAFIALSTVAGHRRLLRGAERRRRPSVGHVPRVGGQLVQHPAEDAGGGDQEAQQHGLGDVHGRLRGGGAVPSQRHMRRTDRASHVCAVRRVRHTVTASARDVGIRARTTTTAPPPRPVDLMPPPHRQAPTWLIRARSARARPRDPLAPARPRPP